MSDSKQQPSRVVESSSSEERTKRTEYVERSDVGVSLTVKLKRGTLEDAREDMETLRGYIHDLAEDARQIQPGEDDE
jgi:hypothetical protein